MILIDTGPILAVTDRRDPRSRDVQRIIDAERSTVVVPAPITAEADYMLTARFGPQSALAFLRDLADGNYQVECLLPHEYQLVVTLSQRYADLAPGLADLSLVVLAARFNSTRLLTFDTRHFRAIEPLQGGAFTLLPMDA